MDTLALLPEPEPEPEPSPEPLPEPAPTGALEPEHAARCVRAAKAAEPIRPKIAGGFCVLKGTLDSRNRNVEVALEVANVVAELGS